MAKLYNVLKAWFASRKFQTGLTGILAALVIVFRYRYSKRSKLISTLYRLDGQHYDIIIVGGGKSAPKWLSTSSNSLLV